MALRHGIHRTLTFVSGLRRYSIGNKKFLNISVNGETRITTLTMNRPPVNALNLDFLTELSETFTEIEQSKSAGVFVTSFSDKVFSTGLDLNEILKPDPVRLKTFWTCLQDVMAKLYESSYPTVAIINGHAPAGGCLLALCCEYRIMVNNFTIGLNETQVGIPVPPWLILLMQNAIGKRHTELAVTTGQLFKTNEALKIGLIDEIASNKADAINKAITFFEQYKTVNPMARTTTKNHLRRPDIEVINKFQEENVEHNVSLLTNSEVQRSIEQYFARIKNKK